MYIFKLKSINKALDNNKRKIKAFEKKTFHAAYFSLELHINLICDRYFKVIFASVNLSNIMLY